MEDWVRVACGGGMAEEAEPDQQMVQHVPLAKVLHAARARGLGGTLRQVSVSIFHPWQLVLERLPPQGLTA